MAHNYPSAADYRADCHRGELARKAKADEERKREAPYKSNQPTAAMMAWQREMDAQRQRSQDKEIAERRRAFAEAKANIPVIAENLVLEKRSAWETTWKAHIGKHRCTSCYVCGLGNNKQFQPCEPVEYFLHVKEDDVPVSKLSGRCCECQVYRDTYWCDRYSVGLRWLCATECWDNTRKYREYQSAYDKEAWRVYHLYPVESIFYKENTSKASAELLNEANQWKNWDKIVNK